MGVKTSIEDWGKNNPVALTIVALLIGLIPFGGFAAVGTYNLGFYYGTVTSENYWKPTFQQKLKTAVDEQLAAKCGQAVSEVNASCQHETRKLENTVASEDEQIRSLTTLVDSLQRKISILDLYSRMVDNAQLMLKVLRDAREKHDSNAERVIKSRFFSLLTDIKRLNEIYGKWGSLFDGRATALTQRYKDAQSIPTEEIITYLDSFSADSDLKRKVIESEVDEANKIQSKKY